MAATVGHLERGRDGAVDVPAEASTAHSPLSRAHGGVKSAQLARVAYTRRLGIAADGSAHVTLTSFGLPSVPKQHARSPSE